MLSKYKQVYGEELNTNYYELNPPIKRVGKFLTGNVPEDLTAPITLSSFRKGGRITKFSR